MVSQVLSLLVTAFQSVSGWFVDLIDKTSAAPIIVSVIAFMLFSRMIVIPLLGGNFDGVGGGYFNISDRVRSSNRRKQIAKETSLYRRETSAYRKHIMSYHNRKGNK